MGPSSSARRHDGAGDAQGRMEPREGADFFPLTVDVEERMYAAGKIPGGSSAKVVRRNGRS